MLRDRYVWKYICDKKSDEIKRLKDALRRACEVLTMYYDADVDRDTYFEDFLRASKYVDHTALIDNIDLDKLKLLARGYKIGDKDGS